MVAMATMNYSTDLNSTNKLKQCFIMTLYLKVKKNFTYQTGCLFCPDLTFVSHFFHLDQLYMSVTLHVKTALTIAE